MSTRRRCPDFNAWNELADKYDALSLSTAPNFATILDAHNRFELSAAMLLAAFKEHRRYPVGEKPAPTWGRLRQHLDDEDGRLQRRPSTLGDVIAPASTGIYIGPTPPAPKPTGKIFGVHFLAVAAWWSLALETLPKHYPDTFRNLPDLDDRSITPWYERITQGRLDEAAEDLRVLLRVGVIACRRLAHAGAWSEELEAPESSRGEEWLTASRIRDKTGITPDALRMRALCGDIEKRKQGRFSLFRRSEVERVSGTEADNL